MSEPVTNTELVTELMEFSPFGALSQLFIMDAIRKAATNVLEAGKEEVEKAFEFSFVNGTSWYECAEYINAELEKRRG